MKTLSALLLAVGMSTAAATTATAMSDEETVAMGRAMLTGAIYSNLARHQMDTASIEKLTLGEIAAINSILNSGDASEGEIKRRVQAILDRAAER